MIEYRFASVAAPGRVNEDAVFQVGDLVGVLDGVTQPDGVDSGCVHGVRWFVDRLVTRVCEAYAAGPTMPLAEILARAIADVRTDHPDCELSNPATPAATVCLVRTSGERLDYLVLCDTTLVLEVDGEITAITDDRFRRVIETLRALPPKTSAAEAASVNRSYTPGKWNYTNREGGYWIAGSDPDAAAHAYTGTIPSARVGRVALLTDGASCAVEPLEILTWPGLLKVLASDGPAELIRQIRTAETQVAASPGFRGKPHDDATAALLVFSEEP